MSERKLVSTGEMAKQLGMSTRSMVDYAKKGILQPATRSPGGHYRWDFDDTLRQWEELQEKRDD